MVTVGGTGISFVVQMILARLMGVDEYGMYAYAISWIAVLLIGARFGLDTLLMRMVAAYTAKKEWSALRGLLASASLISLLVGCALALAAAAVVWFLRDRFSDALFMTFLIGWIAIPLMALSALRQGALRGLKRVALAQIPENLLAPIVLGVSVVIFYFATNASPNSRTVITFYCASMAAAFLVGAFWLRRTLPSEVSEQKAVYHTREWTQTALPLMFMAGISVLMNKTDILMLGAMRGTSDAGIYHVAVRLAGLTSFCILAVNAIAAPMIAELYAEKKLAELQRVVGLAAWGIFAFSVPVCLVLIAGGRYILAIFGEEFVAGYGPLVALALGQVVASLCGSVGYLLTMTGHQNSAAIALTSGVVLNITLNAIMIPLYGAIGAAWATAISIMVWKGTMLLMVRHHIGINSTVLYWPGRRAK